MNSLQDLKDMVSANLTLFHEFTPDEAYDLIEKSLDKHPHFWNENADPEELAKVLAEDDDED